ncbi:MAG: hypothetical protein LBL92_01400 [Propionibacteriaceae bacterium]|nr:hypothetical protein [Propionibacteriaceae bacterium]
MTELSPTRPALPPLPVRPEGEFQVAYNPVSAAQRVAHYTGLVSSRLLWLGVAVVICVVFWLVNGSSLGRVGTLALFGAGLGYSIIWLVMALIGLFRARRVLASFVPGVAVRINRWGVDIHGAALPWSDITAVSARQRRLSAYGPDLAVESRQGQRRSVPWLFLDTLPGSVDAAIQAYTNGTQRLDISRLDH